jgi:hypothetical protein
VIDRNVPVQREVIQKRRLIRLSPHHGKRSRFDYAIESALSFTLNGRVFQQNRRNFAVTRTAGSLPKLAFATRSQKRRFVEKLDGDRRLSAP